jgi:membrane protein
MWHAFRIPLTWRELAIRTGREANNDNALGLAAELAYYFLLALVPAIVFVAALASFFPGQVIQEILNRLAEFAPEDVLTIIREQFQNIAHGGNGGVLTVGLLMALWSSSAALVGLTGALNRAYDIEESRPWWKVRLTAMALTIALATLIIVAFALVMVGPTVADHLFARLGISHALAVTFKVVQWPLAFAMVVLGVGLVFYFGPDADQDWEWVTPGAVLATVLWLVASLLFKFFAANYGNYNETYGSLGGIIVLMLWFYLSALAMLVGAEMNAEIEHASPHAAVPPKLEAGQRRKIGARAARAWAESHPKPKPPDTPTALSRAVFGATLVSSLVRRLRAKQSDPTTH